jgi:hypothetical protein
MRRLKTLLVAGLVSSGCGNGAEPQRGAPASTDVPAAQAIALGTPLRAVLDRSGVRVGGPGWSTRLATRAFGRAASMRTATASAFGRSTAERGGHGARTTIERAGIREWWTASSSQLELGYDVATRPAGEGELRIALAATGDGAFRTTSDGVVAFLDGPAGPRAAPLLELLDLRAYDAAHRALPARFVVEGGELVMVVDDRGAAYPIVVDPVVATGIETKISPAPASPGFGGVLSLSSDGNHLLVKDPATPTVAFYDHGAAGWTSPGDAAFPTASGGTDQYGAYGDGLAFASDGAALACDYRFNYGGMTWAGGVFAFGPTTSYLTAIKPSDAKSDNQFGFSIASSGTSVIVGARTTSGIGAAAYVFTHTSGSAYPQQVKLISPTGTSYFGWKVAIDGNLAIVGALGNEAFGYRRTGTTWDAGKLLTSSDLATGDSFGGSSLAVRGKTLLVGAPGHKITAATDGQVYVFTDTGTDFVKESAMFAAPPTGAAGGAVGSALALSSDESTAFVGAPKAAGGQGRVYVLTRSGTAWTLARTLAPSDPTAAGFGSTLALSGTRLAVGAPTGAAAGFVFVYDPVLGLAPAQACTGAIDCANGNCVDGVCCDTPCAGTCEACNLPGLEGKCSPVKGAPVGARMACPATGTGSCASTCDGITAATCTLPGGSTTCGAATCDASGKAVPAGRCDGAGGCTAASPVACGLFLCVDGACKTSCTADTECAATARCTGGACVVPSLDAGTPTTAGSFLKCEQDGDCKSGHCADGVCCDQPCKDKCSSCAVPGFVGTCLAESGIDLRNDCAAASCSTVCQAGACRPVRAGDQCAPSACVDTHTAQGPSVCSEAGAACAPSSATADCAPFVCEIGACLTSCNDSTQCVAGFTCDPAQGKCVKLTDNTSGGCALADVGAESDGGARATSLVVGTLGVAAALIARRRKRARATR